jgi:hypothetical protein
VLLAVPQPCFAHQTPITTAPPSAPGASRAVEARQHFEAAIAHYRAQRYREAIHEFELSIERIPSADVWFNIGRAHEQLGEYRLAVESYRRYLNERPTAVDAVDLNARIDALTRRAETKTAVGPRKADVGSLAIDAEQPGARVLLDGRELGLAPVDRILEVTPGPHLLAASMPGFVPFRARIEVQPGGLSAAYVDLRPLTRRRAVREVPPWAWLAGGTAAASLVASGTFGVLAVTARDENESARSARWSRASDWALGGALIFATTAAIIYLSSSEVSPSPPR